MVRSHRRTICVVTQVPWSVELYSSVSILKFLIIIFLNLCLLCELCLGYGEHSFFFFFSQFPTAFKTLYSPSWLDQLHTYL